MSFGVVEVKMAEEEELVPNANCCLCNYRAIFWETLCHRRGGDKDVFHQQDRIKNIDIYELGYEFDSRGKRSLCIRSST